MAENEKINFDLVAPGAITAISAQHIDFKFPLESYVTEYQLENARANVHIPGVNKVLSAKLDLDGNGEITKLEIRKADGAAKELANEVKGTKPEDVKDDIKGVHAEIEALEPQADDAKIVMSRKSLLAEMKEEVKQEDLPTILGVAGEDKVKYMETAIKAALKGTPLENMYKPDGKITNAEGEYFCFMIDPATLPKPQAKQGAEAVPAK